METELGQLNNKEKLLKLFKFKHGPCGWSGACTAEVCYNPNNPDAEHDLVVACMKDGEICWYETREDLLFYYCTQNL